MSCTACFESIISSCNDIVVKAELPANHDLYWVIRKAGSDNIYQKLTSTNSDGDLVISKADLPGGFLISGRIMEIQVRDGENYLNPVSFVFGGKQYTCIIATCKQFTRAEDDNSEVNVIQFTQSIIPG